MSFSFLWDPNCSKHYCKLDKNLPIKSKQTPPIPNRVSVINPIVSRQPMMLFLKRNLSFPSPLRFSSLSSIALSIPSNKSEFVANYLIESCGFSPEKAATVSKDLNFTSPSKPDSVRHFLKHHAGLTDAHIRSIIARNCRVLGTDVGRVMEPNLTALRRITSWSDSEIQNLIIVNPFILISPLAISRLEFWKNFLRGNMMKLFLAVTRNPSLFFLDVDKSVAKRIGFLKEYGFSQTDIGYIIVSGKDGLFTRSIDSMEALIKKVEGLGLPRGSPRFLRGLLSVSRIGLDAFDGKMDFFKGYGWSETEVLTAFQNNPQIVRYSEDNIKEKMEFLVGTVGCTQSYIAARPLLLMLSLEKRLKPRHHVMCILKSAKLLGSKPGFSSIMRLSESKFIELIIHQYKDKVPELHDIYTAACAGQFRN